MERVSYTSIRRRLTLKKKSDVNHSQWILQILNHAILEVFILHLFRYDGSLQR
jgi:hypothetical protein